MSRFDVKVVNETWAIARDKAGRKLAKGKDGDRDVQVFVSDIKGPDGLYPLMEKYLLPYPIPLLKDGVVESKFTAWITRAQFNELCGDLDMPLKAAAGIQAIQIAGKVISEVMSQLQKKGTAAGGPVAEDFINDMFKTLLAELPTLVATIKF